jgi:hypothetical protein
MKFGQVEDPSTIDFTIPPDHADTDRVLAKSKAKSLKVYIGCAKWNKADLKNFYPKGTKDELTYYATQFNCVELNATFYRLFPPSQFEKWKNTVGEGFKFFPKLGQEIALETAAGRREGRRGIHHQLFCFRGPFGRNLSADA